MGQEETIIERSDPVTLEETTLAAVGSYIKSGKASRIVVLSGAGISTAAGIPDFRSPKTGLYQNLARLNLKNPEDVFTIDFFRDNPHPFYALAKELYPGRYHPTISHAFIALLHDKGLLHMLFTQNIDCLDRVAGVPNEKIVEAHGSFHTQRCIECKTPFPDDLMKDHVDRGEPPHCTHSTCGGLVKPDITFFGEKLPEAFFRNVERVAETDLLFIMGTSLQVAPFSMLPDRAGSAIPRVLFNMERVGSLGRRSDDVLELDACDVGIRKLAAELGWLEELERKWRAIVGDEEAEKQAARTSAMQLTEDLEEADDELVESMATRISAIDLDETDWRPSSLHSPAVNGPIAASEEVARPAIADGVDGGQAAPATSSAPRPAEGLVVADVPVPASRNAGSPGSSHGSSLVKPLGDGQDSNYKPPKPATTNDQK